MDQQTTLSAVILLQVVINIVLLLRLEAAGRRINSATICTEHLYKVAGITKGISK